MTRCVRIWVVALMMVVVWAGTGLCAEQQQVPTRINSDTMKYSANGGSVVFSGSVVVKRPDFNLWADSITVRFAGSTKASAEEGLKGISPGDISSIAAKGNVRIERETSRGECASATYNVKDGVFTMEGNPVLIDGKNRIEGETIRFYVKDNRSEVIGGKQKRVEALFFAPAAKGIK